MAKELYQNLPDTPGVYLMKNAKGELLYVGKAGNLKRRVSSYFLRPHDARIQKMVSEIARIDHRDTDTAIEALILEAKLIKELHPVYNVKEKDDKSFLYVEFTKEKFPRVFLVRGKDVAGFASEAAGLYGPFTSASNLRGALRILRKIFPWSVHDPEKLGKYARPCFDYEVGLCPGTCIGAVNSTDYRKNIGRLKLFFEGKKKRVLRSLEREMVAASKRLDFERAAKFRRQIFALQHIRDIALISESAESAVSGPEISAYRIEGYDISNISGTSAVGSMVVFENGEPNKNEYRKFKIRTLFTPNDVGMLEEVLTRRFRRSAAASGKMPAKEIWPLPDLILIDGGAGQVNAARKVLKSCGLRIPVIGMAKGPERKRIDIVGAAPKHVPLRTLIRVRDEAHRFAISYHKYLRGRESGIALRRKKHALE